jgi:hypothetical protein
MVVDIDNSGFISDSEAFRSLVLGCVFGAGLGAAMAGFAPQPVALTITGMSALFLRFGMWMGFTYAGRFNQRAYSPGVILFVLGLFRFI